MSEPVIGSEAVTAGALTRAQLRWQYAAIHPGVYIPKHAERTLLLRAHAAWLWTGRRGIIAGRAAAALHGAKWVDATTPIEIITAHGRRRDGLIVREERIGDDEVVRVGELPVTSLARTAFDLARHLPRDVAVVHLDSLSAATGVTAADTNGLAQRYRGGRGVRRSLTALALMDAGAASPQETRLRLTLIDGGLPKPRTQIRVFDGYSEAFIDMGYDEPKVGLEYEGAHYATNRGQYVHDIGRAELIEREGWIDLRVVAEHSRRYILHRVREAFARRGWTPPSSTSGS
ncbi:hypothetical protein [Mycolicibacterium litorale]|uniref:Cullin, a subunit of E3 ubiquitin ligase n=1 Tax=Mycolicibacterium litorale TaxID=758802 RepID=A0AAD1IR48_9MYCO|nr:hypothetical protein [Mycolicibacterium litorale]MCV7418430.1 hypothetical protein [Mycolicibacterium litorale]TDY06173.1 hypothetical protein BCL50_2489 [Mycolicibacterium litorale]BBY19684.1 hypothetical protein MLIT_52760 [Mycolicibacterium litorale]